MLTVLKFKGNSPITSDANRPYPWTITLKLMQAIRRQIDVLYDFCLINNLQALCQTSSVRGLNKCDDCHVVVFNKYWTWQSNCVTGDLYPFDMFLWFGYARDVSTKKLQTTGLRLWPKLSSACFRGLGTSEAQPLRDTNPWVVLLFLTLGSGWLKVQRRLFHPWTWKLEVT